MNQVTFAPDDDSKECASIYNIMINSNRTQEDISVHEFERIIYRCLLGFRTQEFITTNTGYDPDLTMRIAMERPAIEIGGKMGRVHCHIYTTILHNSNIRINIGAMKKRLPEGYNVSASLHLPASREMTRTLRYNMKEHH